MAAAKPPLQPTVMGEVARPKRSPVLKPTPMPGTTPQRLAPDPADLRALAPDADAAAVEAARGLLTRLIPAHIDHRTALFWGQDLQIAHRDLMQQRLALSQAPLLSETASHLARLRQILGSIDPEALANPGGLGTQAFRRLSRLIDTPDEVAGARGEIDALLQLLTTAQGGLLAQRDRLQRHASALQTMEAQVEAQALAAGWLALHAAPEHRRSFADRRSSLQATLLQIRSAALQLTNDTQMPTRLMLAVQTIALVALPAWLERLSHLQARLAQGRIPTPTEARELAFRLNDLLPLFPRTE